MRMQKLVDKLQSRVNVIMKGGGEKAVARHTSRGTTYKNKAFLHFWPNLMIFQSFVAP